MDETVKTSEQPIQKTKKPKEIQKISEKGKKISYKA